MGYVGLATAIPLAESGVVVVGYDISEERLSIIKNGKADLLPVDQQKLHRHLGSDSFTLTTNLAEVRTADAVVVCVPTPVDHNLDPDLTALASACDVAVRHAVRGQVIMLTSTTYVGCTREYLVEPLRARGLKVGVDVFVAFGPERIDPGLEHGVVPRVVGGVTDACGERAEQLARLITPAVHRVSSAEAAEAAKLLENTFRAVNIAFANEFADACTELGLDSLEVIRAAATKPYGFMPFYPGAGVGGHCIPTDPHYLLWQLRERQFPLSLTESAMRQIAARPKQVTARIRALLARRGLSLAGARILIIGVTYKPGVSDVRSSPALEIMAELAEHGAVVGFTDPVIETVAVGGHTWTGVPPADAADWDLAVIHTVNPGVDHGWLVKCPTVLDTTFGVAGVPGWVGI
jgi:nucleotide sugar dehydrogenase